jgi:hypothetical protein
MMKEKPEATSILAPLFRQTDGPSPVFLLGAGASFRSGIPTAAEAVKKIARRVYSEQHLSGDRPPERVKPSEWEPWLQSMPWFIEGPERLAENFPLAVEKLLVPAEFRKRVLLDLMRPSAGLSPGYKVLADFNMRGLTQTILTTNFDTCVTDALKERQPHIRDIYEVNTRPGDFDQFNVYNRCQVVWLHGRAENYSDRNAAGEVGQPDNQLTSVLRPVLDGSPIIVVGYRGAEPSIMQGIFAQTKGGRRDFSHGVYWCVRTGETPHPNVQALARRLGSNFRLLTIDGFDHLMADLARELEGFDRYAPSRPDTIKPKGADSFDERVVETASLDDLDLDLALTVLREYCEKLKRAPVTRDSLNALMREQGLIVSEDKTDKITAAALLLFGKGPQEFFPHAVVSVTEAGKKREIYDGNLIRQHRKLLEKLEAPQVNPILKVKKRRVHDERQAYPPRVLVELLVNLLVHRDYESPEAAGVEILPNSEIIFSNPGALRPRIAGRVSVDEDGRFTLDEGITDQRNPSLCDIFFGISAMERAGTGLMDVHALMVEGGGTSAFYHYGFEARFEARVMQPHASAGSAGVARSDVPTGFYLLNYMPFAVVPDSVSVVQLKKPIRERPPSLDLSDCGTFVDRGTELWSFVPHDILLDRLDPIADRKTSRAFTRAEIEALPDSKRVLSWLLRKHWERFLLAFENQGLILEQGRKHRAYFQARDEENRTIVWDSVQKRNNRRDVVKKRGEGHRAWFENEGFGYDVSELGGMWCVRIKPFYMFTGRDGRRPLPSFVRTSKATRRMKFDRNKNVEADLTFWSTFLGRGNETINIGNRHVDDLVLESSFLTVEVPEIGLISDEREHQNRMPARA